MLDQLSKCVYKCNMQSSSLNAVIEFIITQKGREALIWQGCKFTLNLKMANGKRYWRCVKRSCPARITTEGDEVLQQTVIIILKMLDKLKWKELSMDEPKRRSYQFQLAIVVRFFVKEKINLKAIFFKVLEVAAGDATTLVSCITSLLKRKKFF